MSEESLPSKATSMGVSIDGMVWALFGPPGVGKSTLASAFEWDGKVPFFLYTTPLPYIHAMKRPVDSWKSFCKYVKLLDTPVARKRYSAIILDRVDDLHNYCRVEVMERHGHTHESDLEHGKGWDMVRKEFHVRIAKLINLGYAVVFISHSKEREIKTRFMQFTKQVPTLQPTAWNGIAAICNVIGYCGYSNMEMGEETKKTPRRVWFEPSEYIECKDWTGKLPRYQVMHRLPNGKPDAARTVKELMQALKGKPESGSPTKARKLIRRSK